MKKFIGVLIIILGLVFIFSPFISEYIIKNISHTTRTIDLETIKKNNIMNEGSDNYQCLIVNDLSLKEALKAQSEYNIENTIGLISIPKLDILLPVMEGVNDSNLLVGAATMKRGQKMGQANYALAGHNMKNKSLLFGRLMDIEVGTEVYLTDASTVYKYIIKENKVVPDDDLDMIDDRKAEKGPIISLMTCYHTSASGKRFFSIGQLVDSYPLDDNDFK